MSKLIRVEDIQLNSLSDYQKRKTELFLANQPIAYDVDKVIKQLELLDRLYYGKVALLPLDDVINIVKRGGI